VGGLGVRRHPQHLSIARSLSLSLCVCVCECGVALTDRRMMESRQRLTISGYALLVWSAPFHISLSYRFAFAVSFCGARVPPGFRSNRTRGQSVKICGTDFCVRTTIFAIVTSTSPAEIACAVGHGSLFWTRPVPQ